MKATGKPWLDWFAFIDDGGGKDLDHKGIVALLKQNSSLSPWWQQMVTVEYEKARGKRKAHEMVDGFQISKSKTISASQKELFDAWMDQKSRKKWLEDVDFVVTKATEPRSIRITWVDGSSHLDVYLYARKEKTQVTINHGKLPDETSAARMKSYWEKQLGQLSALFE